MSTLVKNNYAYPSFFENFFGKDSTDLFVPTSTGTLPSVNVVETQDGFRIEVAAPGLDKNDFKINLDHNQLTISAEVKKEEEKVQEKYTRREFKYTSFQRVFSLPNTIDGEKIGAGYNNGILTIHLPKREEAKVKPSRTIESG
jgi:HSP20 family protein